LLVLRRLTRSPGRRRDGSERAVARSPCVSGLSFVVPSSAAAGPHGVEVVAGNAPNTLLLGSATFTVVIATDPLMCNSRAATIVGTSGNDRLVGTDGPDVIVGLGGDDQIAGLGGDDSICAGSGNDQVDAGDGNDFVFGGLGDDALAAGNGNDTLAGEAGMDRLAGGAGNDLLDGGVDPDACADPDGTTVLVSC
jgi:Ca2+-binding RTX toxin-like protein